MASFRLSEKTPLVIDALIIFMRTGNKVSRLDLTKEVENGSSSQDLVTLFCVMSFTSV